MNEQQSGTPITPYFTRRAVAEFVTKELGAPLSFSHLEKLCMDGKGPPVFRWWGNRPLYEREAVRVWALARMSDAPPPLAVMRNAS